jgi:hypothetical protein
MAGHISWKQFEGVNARLQKTFAKTGKVTIDERLEGRNSGVTRQIDVAIRASVGTEKLLIIIECKRWNRKIDVKGVEAFNGVKDDVGAHAAIMVSTQGFTKAAKNTAEAKGISLYRYEDTFQAGWPTGVETNVLLEVWELIPTVFRVVLADGSTEDCPDANLIDIRADEKTGAAASLRKIWDQLDSAEKYNREWVCELPVSTPERSEVRALQIGAISTKIRGYRKGRLQFEGLVDDSKGIAKVDHWKMVFSGDFIPLPENEVPPPSQTLQLRATITHVKTQDSNSEKALKALYGGVFEIAINHESVSDLPLRVLSPKQPKVSKPRRAK